MCVFPQIPLLPAPIFTQALKRAFIGVCFCSCVRPPCIFFVSELLETLMVFLWRVREVLGRCLREGHIARGVSQDTCPMIMFMRIITGLGSRRVPSLENSGGLNFKLYCYPLKKKWRDWSPCPKNVCTIGKVSLLTVKAGCLFSFLLFSSLTPALVFRSVIAQRSTSYANINQLTLTQRRDKMSLPVQTIID